MSWCDAGFRLEYATGIGVEGTYARFNVSIQNLQLDDQLPFTRCSHLGPTPMINNLPFSHPPLAPCPDKHDGHTYGACTFLLQVLNLLCQLLESMPGIN